MKKFLLSMICVLSFISNANAVVVTEEVYVNHTSNNQIIGKRLNDCKIVDTYIYDNTYNIVCVKDGQLYRASYTMKRLMKDCDKWLCGEAGYEIPELFED